MRTGIVMIVVLMVWYVGLSHPASSDQSAGPAPRDSTQTPGAGKKRQKKPANKGVARPERKSDARQSPQPQSPPPGDQPVEPQGRQSPPPGEELLPGERFDPITEPMTRPEDVLFPIIEFHVEGNTLLKDSRIEDILTPFKGLARKISDIDKARAELEKAYHDLGYPTVLVTVPEQHVEKGTVTLKVVESRIGQLTVTDNRYFSSERILEKLPSVRPGWLINEPELSKELAAVNANPDRQVSPVLKPGQEPGTVDMDLKVRDRLPLHARLQADNRGSTSTPRDRMTAEVQYTNLWDREHILTLQTVQTPTNWGAVQTYGATYVAPLPNEHMLTTYFAKTKSNSVLAGTSLAAGGGGDIGIVGNAIVTGFRYTIPLKPIASYKHQVAVGMDYKRLEETTATFPAGLGNAVVLSPIQYTPMSANYSGYVQDSLGLTSGSAGAKGYVAGMIPGGSKTDFGGNPNDPFNQPGDRKGSTGTFFVLQGSLERFQRLPEDFSLLLHADGQWANEPLIPAEEYFAGGLDTVRGYVQYEAIGDNAARARVEGQTPSVTIPFDRLVNPRLKVDLKGVAFYDAAFLWVRRPQPGQTDKFQLEGVGGGIRANILPFNIRVILDQGFALRDAVVTKKGDTFVHFSVEIAY